MFRRWLTLMHVCSVLTIEVRVISYGLYVPLTIDKNASLILPFSTDCNECLCNAFLSNVTFAVVNCRKDTQQCFFYENLAINYTLALNLHVSAYFSPLSAVPTTTTMLPSLSSTYKLRPTSMTPSSAYTTAYMSTQTSLSNVWIPTKNMTIARMGHTSTYIPEIDSVLITGGENQSSTEMFVSSNRSFVRRGNMTTIRGYHTADRLGTNSILIAGGNTADIYDPIEGTVNKTVNMSTTRFWHKSSTVNMTGNMETLLSGGVPSQGSSAYMSSADEFNSSTNIFNLKTMPIARYYHTSTALPNGNILIAGGQSNGGSIVDSLLLYNTSTHSFVNVTAKMSAPRYYFTATYIPSIQSILFSGGYASGSGNMNTYDLFNVTTMQFVRNGTLLYARSTHTATLLQDGRVLLSGGYPTIYQTEIFEPLTFTFNVAANLSVGRCYHTATILDNSGEVLVCGGQGASGSLNSCEI